MASDSHAEEVDDLARAPSRDLSRGEYDGLRPGLTRAEVEVVAGAPVRRSFKRGLSTEDTVEYSGCYFVSYGSNGRATGLEFFEGSDPNFMGIPLLGRPLLKVLNDLAGVGVFPSKSDADGCDFDEQRFGLFVIDGRVVAVNLEAP